MFKFQIQNFPNEAIQGSVTSGSRRASKEVTTFGTKFHLVPSAFYTQALGARQTNPKFRHKTWRTRQLFWRAQIPNPKAIVCNLWLVTFGLFLIYYSVFAIISSFAQEVGKMKKVVMVIAQNDFRDEELLQPKNILEKGGVNVKVASSSLSEAKGMLGAKVKPDILISDVKIDEYDGIIFVGGRGASEYWNSPVAHRLAKEADAAGKIVAAICIAPVTLANAGILEGKKATVWESEARQLFQKGVRSTGRKVERDGNIITANSPIAAEEFGRAILEALSQ